MDLSVCVVSYNTRDLLRDCLASVYRETEGLVIEVIVVDNASTDGSVEMVRREFPDVQLIANAENRRFAAANNQAFSVARGEFVLLLNSDTLVLDRAPARMAGFMRTHADVGAVGCRLVSQKGTPVRAYGMFPSVLRTTLVTLRRFSGLRLFPLYRSDGVYPADKTEPIEVGYPSGACMMTRREVLETVGHLDESFWFYGEEVDFCYRMKVKGWKRMLLPVRVMHVMGGSSEKGDVKTGVRCKMADYRFVRKHRAYAYWLLFLGSDILATTVLGLVMFAKRVILSQDLAPVREQFAVLRGALRCCREGKHLGPLPQDA